MIEREGDNRGRHKLGGEGYCWVASINLHTGGCISTHDNTGENDYTHTYTHHHHAYTAFITHLVEFY